MKVQSFAHAIAKAEGFYIRGTVPSRYHNPGDLTCPRFTHCYDGQRGVSKRGYVIFRNDAAGWSALKQQLTSIINGTSKKYDLRMTFAQMGHIYACDRRWARKITGWLGVDLTTTLAEYFEIPPSPFQLPPEAFNARLSSTRTDVGDTAQCYGQNPLRRER